MMPLKEMAIRVLLNLGELDPGNYPVSVLIGALALHNESAHLWKELLPRLRECTNRELLRIVKKHEYTDRKERLAVENVLKERLPTLSAKEFFVIFEHVAVFYTPDTIGDDMDDDEAETEELAEWDEKDEAVFASWRAEAIVRFGAMTNAELAVGLRDTDEDAVRLAIIDAVLPRAKIWGPDEIALFWRDAAYDSTFWETVERECAFSFGRCGAEGLLRVLDAPSAYYIWEKLDEALYAHINDFKKIADISG